MSNTDDLKAELLEVLAGPAATFEECLTPSRRDELRARLEKATITEPRWGVECVIPGPEDRRVRFKRRAPGDPWSFVGFVNPTPPTDAELIEALRVELGEGWIVYGVRGNEDYGVPLPRAWPCPWPADGRILTFTYEALRSPNGPAEVARALRVLAGQGVK